MINLKDASGVHALVILVDMITNRFSFRLEVDGERRSMTRAKLSTYVRKPWPQIHARACQELFQVHRHQTTRLGQIHNYCARDWTSENLTMRGLDAPVTVRNLLGSIPDHVVGTLLHVCRENAALFRR